MKSYLTVTSQCAAPGCCVIYEGKGLNWVNRAHQGAGWRLSSTLPVGAARGSVKETARLGRGSSPQGLRTSVLYLPFICYQPMKLIFFKRKNVNSALFLICKRVGGGIVLAGLFCSIDLWPTKEMSTYETQINATRLRKCKQRCEKIIQSLVFYGI